MHVHGYRCIQIYTYIYIERERDINIYIYIYTNIHTCMHTYIHTYITVLGLKNWPAGISQNPNCAILTQPNNVQFLHNGWQGGMLVSCDLKLSPNSQLRCTKQVSLWVRFAMYHISGLSYYHSNVHIQSVRIVQHWSSWKSNQINENQWKNNT